MFESRRNEILKKSKSLDSVNFSDPYNKVCSLTSTLSKAGIHYNNSKASKFSSVAQRARCHLPVTPEVAVPQNPSFLKSTDENFENLQEVHTRISNSNSFLSLHGLDVSETHEKVQSLAMELKQILPSQIFNVRLSPLLHFIAFSCFLFGTLSDMTMRVSPRDKSYDFKNKAYNVERKGMLGSAMISSVTETLSPILPFAGGIDLRRDDNWKGFHGFLWGNDISKSKTANDGNSQSIVSIPRGGDVLLNQDFTLIIAAQDPFLPTEVIAQMTLREIAFLFKYAIDANGADFKMESYIDQNFEGEPISLRMKNAIIAIDDAVRLSMGNGVLPAQASRDSKSHASIDSRQEDNEFGDIDALRFCAVMRILGEWRVLRQVPVGFKQYAVGMKLGHKDVVQNVAKIESAVHEWIALKFGDKTVEQLTVNKSELCTDDESEACINKTTTASSQLRSPTLRQLLQHEIEFDIHPNGKLPRLKEKTAAMGLLWVRRQLQYQFAIFDNVISVPKTYETSTEAIKAAYSEIYGQIHGWAVQKIFNYSFQSAPEANEIFKIMNPRRLIEVGIKAKNLESSEPVDLKEYSSSSSVLVIDEKQSHDLPADLKMKENTFGEPSRCFFEAFQNDLNNMMKHFESELNRFGKQIVRDFDKTLCNISNILDNDHDVDCKSILIKGATPTHQSKWQGMTPQQIENYISKEMRKDARDHILVYLKTTRPMLDDLVALIMEMNMEDPSKV